MYDKQTHSMKQERRHETTTKTRTTAIRLSLDWIVQCFTSPPTQYRLYGRRFLQVKRPNQQYQSTERDATKENTNNAENIIHTEIRNRTR